MSNIVNEAETALDRLADKIFGRKPAPTIGSDQGYTDEPVVYTEADELHPHDVGDVPAAVVPFNHSSDAIADIPEQVGWMPDPDNVIEGYGPPEQGDTQPVQDLAPMPVVMMAPARTIEEAADDIAPVTFALAATDVPAQVAGYLANCRGRALTNLGTTEVWFAKSPSLVGPSAGVIPAGATVSLAYRGPLYALSSSGVGRLMVLSLLNV